MLDRLFTRDPTQVAHPSVEFGPLRDEMVVHAERRLGVTLPRAFVDLLRTCNGGYTADAAFPTTRPTSWADDHVPVVSISGIPGPDDLDSLGLPPGILATPYLIEEWGLPKGIVVIDGDGHAWIALDYRSTGPTGPPSVVWLDVDRGDDLTLASTFEEFLAGLVPSEHFQPGR